MQQLLYTVHVNVFTGQVHGRLRGGALPVPPHLAEQLMAAADGGHCHANNFNWPHRLREVGGKHMARRAAVSPGGFYHIRRRFAEVRDGRGGGGGQVGRECTIKSRWKTRLFFIAATTGCNSWNHPHGTAGHNNCVSMTLTNTQNLMAQLKTSN